MDMDYEKWYEDAVNYINSSIAIGQHFEVKSLFTGAKWDKLSAGDKKSFGRYFSGKVKDGMIDNVIKEGEGKSHHNKYRRLK